MQKMIFDGRLQVDILLLWWYFIRFTTLFAKLKVNEGIDFKINRFIIVFFKLLKVGNLLNTISFLQILQRGWAENKIDCII